MFFSRLRSFLLVLALSMPVWANATEPLYLSLNQRFFISLGIELATAPRQRLLELAARTAAQAPRWSRVPRTVIVHDFNEFLRLWQGEWPNSHSLSWDLDQLLKDEAIGPRRFQAPTLALQRRIDAYIADQPGRLRGALRARGLDEAALVDAIVKSEGATAKERLMSIGSSILESQMERINETSRGIADRAFQEAKDKAMTIALRTVFSGYYSQLGMESKKSLISGLLGTDLAGDEMQFFEVLLQNSGPQLQKLLQRFAREEGLDPSVAAVLQQLEKDVKPVPPTMVRQIIEAEREAYPIESYEPEPLGVGSMAQVHRAILRVNSRLIKVVLRFLKPGIAERVEEDHRILVACAKQLDANPEFRATKAPRLSPLVDEISNSVRAELDLDATTQRQKDAKVYERTVRTQVPGLSALLVKIHVPGVYEPHVRSKLQVQEQVVGSSLEKVAARFVDTFPHLRQVVAETVATDWLETALLGSGLYHADLHRGNLLVEMGDSEVDVELIDYGMGGTLSRDLQEGLIAFATAVQAQDPILMARFLWKLSDSSKNRVTQVQLERAIRKELEAIRAGQAPHRDLKDWSVFALDQGLGVLYDVVNFNGGASVIEKFLAQSGSHETFDSLSMKMARRAPVRVIGLLLRQGFTVRQLVDMGLGEALNAFGGGKDKKTSESPSAGAIRCEAIF